MSSRELSALWVHGQLGYIERLCLTSALDTDHKVVLYTYSGCENVPHGTDVRDAREIMPERFVMRYRNGSYALAADFFRFFLLSKRNTCWFDADMLFLRPRPDDDYIFGWEDEMHINSAILRLPSESQILSDIISFAQSSPVIPPWWTRRKKMRQRIRALVGKARPIDKLEWGILGPRAITHFARQACLLYKSAPPEVYYPNHWSNADDIFDPGID